MFTSYLEVDSVLGKYTYVVAMNLSHSFICPSVPLSLSLSPSLSLSLSPSLSLSLFPSLCFSEFSPCLSDTHIASSQLGVAKRGWGGGGRDYTCSFTIPSLSLSLSLLQSSVPNVIQPHPNVRVRPQPLNHSIIALTSSYANTLI